MVKHEVNEKRIKQKVHKSHDQLKNTEKIT